MTRWGKPDTRSSRPVAAVTRIATVPTALGLLAGLLLLGACSTGSLAVGEAGVTSTLPAPGEDARGIIIIAHGTGSGADKWPVWFDDRIRGLPGNELWDIFRINWGSLSDRYLSAASSGYELGRTLGTELADHRQQYEIIHLIGQSMGAHVVHGIAQAYRSRTEGTQRGTIIHITFFDPFLPRGVFRVSYGQNHFGRYADFAESYFTRDEPVWFTNTPVRHAVNFDLTAIVPPKENPWFTYYHDHPFIYYRDSINISGVGPGFALSPFALCALCEDSRYNPAILRELLPPGTVIEVR